MCQCHKTNFKNSENNIISEDVLKFIESMFQFSLKQKQVRENQDLFEHISLKYISFIAKYRNNPVKAYYELKQIMSLHTDKISFYFDCIQNIFSLKIEEMILLHQQNKLKEKKDQNKVTSTRIDDDVSKLELIDFIQSDKFKIKILPLIQSFVHQKVNLYEKMRSGFEKLSLLGDSISIMSKTATIITNELKKNLGRNISFSVQSNQAKRTSQNVYILKILSIYEGIVLNRVQESMKYEELILELKKRDYLLNQAVLNTLNILKGNILTVIISFSKERGKIKSLNSRRINSFFGYSQNQESNIQYIDQLMPQFLQQIHNSLMQNYILRSYSPLIKQSHFSYAMNSEGFIFPISISVENIFEQRDDFCLYGSILKLENAKELFVFNIKGQILGFTQLIFEEAFKIAEQNFNSKQKKVYLDAFNVMQKISIYLILPEILDVILRHQQQQSEEEGLEKFNLNSSIETIASNQQGVIKIPDSIFDLQNQFKANQYFISEKSKGQSQTSLQTSIFQNQDVEEIVDSYQTFYKENLVEWSKDNLVSETKIKYNLLKQSLKHIQDNKKTTEDFYIIQINEQSKITTEIDRKDSLEINSPKKNAKRKGDALSPHKNFTNRRMSFYDVFKLASQQQINQQIQINNAPSNQALQGTPYMRRRFVQEIQDNDQLNQSSTSLDKYVSQNNNLSPGIGNKQGERKSRILSSFSHLSDKNNSLSQQNIYERSLVNLNNETNITSNQNFDFNQKVEDNKQIIQKIKRNSSFNSEVLSPLKRLLGPQFSKDKHLIKTASKDFEPKFTIDDTEKPEEEKIKIKNLFLHQSSIASSSATARSRSPKPKLSLWQRIKNRVAAANNTQQPHLQKGVALFLKERQEAFNEEKHEKILQNPDTISSNTAMDMDYENDIDDVDLSSVTKKGTTTVRKNGKSTQEPKTNQQIRSISHISSQSSRGYGTYLFYSIAYSFHLPSIFNKLKIFFGNFLKQQTQLMILFSFYQIVVFIIIFASLQTALSLGIISQYSQLQEDLAFNQIALTDDSSFQMQILNSINQFAIQLELISQEYQTVVQNQITKISSNYESIFPQILQKYLNCGLNQLYKVSIFSFNNQQVEQKSLAELKYYNLNSVTQVLQLGKNSNKLLNDQFFYLVKNSLMNQELDKSLLSNSFQDYKDLQNTLNNRANFFIGCYVIIFFIFILLFFPFLRQINVYQERVLHLIARLNEGECLQEQTKLSDVLKYIQSKNEQWVYKNFMINDPQSLNEALKKSIKSNNFIKTQKQPISSRIKNQNIKNYRQIFYFVFISLLGLIYFSIFIMILKKHSNNSYKYLNFFEFSQFALPSFNSMVIDWSILINYSYFQQKNQYFPQIDITQLNQDYQYSLQNISSFLTQFQQEIDQLSSIGNSNYDQLNLVYTESLCKYFEEQQLCDELSDQTNQMYEQGLAGLLSNYIQFFNNYKFLLSYQPPNVQQSQLKMYYSTIQFSELILKNYENTVNFFKEIVNISLSAYNTFYNDFKRTHLLYSLIFGIFIILLFIIMALLLYKRSILRLINVNFGLTCFPNSKIQEESTLQMLKFIRNI